MARPPKNAEGPSVRERIKEAFWELYGTRPLEKVSVKDVCARAQYNKTTFYYHFGCTADVLAEIEADCMPSDVPRMVADVVTGRVGEDALERFVAENERRIETIRLLLGPRGDPGFKFAMERAVLEAWCENLEVNPSKLDRQDEMFIRYSVGGVTNILSESWSDGEVFDFVGLYEFAIGFIAPQMGKMIKKYSHGRDD